jgi:hypothetical protein
MERTPYLTGPLEVDVMNKTQLRYADEERFSWEISDVILERAGSSLGMVVPTLVGTYWIGCPLRGEVRPDYPTLLALPDARRLV